MHKQMNALGRKMNGNTCELYFKFYAMTDNDSRACCTVDGFL